MSGANLSSANLSGTNLSGADLTFANLTDANQTDANLTDTKLGGLFQGPLAISVFIGKQLAAGAISYVGKSLFVKALGDNNPFAPDNPNVEYFNDINNKLDIINANIADLNNNVDGLYTKLEIAKNEIITTVIYPSTAIDTIISTIDIGGYVNIVNDIKEYGEDKNNSVDSDDINKSMNNFSKKVLEDDEVYEAFLNIRNRIEGLSTTSTLLPLLANSSISIIGTDYNHKDIFYHYEAMEAFLSTLIIHQLNAANIIIEANSYLGNDDDNEDFKNLLKKTIEDEVSGVGHYSLLYNAYNLILRNRSIPDNSPAVLPENATKILERAHFYKSYILNEESNSSDIDFGVHISYISTADMESAPDKLYAKDWLDTESNTIYTCDKSRSFSVDGRDYDYWEDIYNVTSSREYNIAEYKCESNISAGREYYLYSSVEDALATNNDSYKRGSFFVNNYDNYFEPINDELSEQKYSYGFALIDATISNANKFKESDLKWELITPNEVDSSWIRVKGDANSWPIKLYPEYIKSKDDYSYFFIKGIEGAATLQTNFIYSGEKENSMTISYLVNHSFYSRNKGVGMERASFDLTTKIQNMSADKYLKTTSYSEFTQGMNDGEEIEDSSSLTYSFTAQPNNMYGIEFDMNIRSLDATYETGEDDLYWKINNVEYIYIRFKNTDSSINLK
ncbi:MAG: pentapeptide repeat-containing protein [Campylobacterota bacterium]|nr:pentapeptide repeat-containing protein [Campylobacterota bacterium]